MAEDEAEKVESSTKTCQPEKSECQDIESADGLTPKDYPYLILKSERGAKIVEHRVSDAK
ncbi:MAG: hypothetical protein ALECFALPRED_008415 [Alectoria fallacina]|uniref:Uncharacterized protein n=1 Tax=Alectoria fallacina TaxID=1903189 RepID=A0A8H3J3H9_9LECA|nr:MAG: hypothetical protein ALECFALPRED_008415 [Alectoria fallacina]